METVSKEPSLLSVKMRDRQHRIQVWAGIIFSFFREQMGEIGHRFEWQIESIDLLTLCWLLMHALLMQRNVTSWPFHTPAHFVLRISLVVVRYTTAVYIIADISSSILDFHTCQNNVFVVFVLFFVPGQLWDTTCEAGHGRFLYL